MKKSVLLALISALLFVSVLGALWFFAATNRRATERHFQGQYQSLSKAATQLVQLGITTGRVDEEVETMLVDLQSNELFTGAVIYDVDGDALLTVPADLEVPSSAAAMEGAGTVSSGSVVYEVAPLAVRNGAVIGRLLLAFSFEARNREAREAFVRTVLFGLVILVPVMALISWLVTGREKQLRRYEVVRDKLSHSEEALRQAQKMEAIGRLTGGIAHDFNNLLTVIIANAQVIDEALLSGQTETRSVVREVTEAARRGSSMVRKLLAFGRGETLSLRATDLSRVVDELSSTMRSLLPATIEIRTSSAEDVPAAYADPGAVEQILLNLATNARDAMPNGGLFDIQVRRGWLDEDHWATHGWGEPGDYVCLVARDTGSGMEESTRTKAFEPFFTTKPQGEGTGLGMAMIYGLIKQHGGYVEIGSKVGEGTTVTVYFPTAGESAPDAPAPAGPGTLSGGTETILLAEDEAGVRRVAQRVLEEHGYTVLAANNGVDALRVFRARRSDIDLVLTDLTMPKMGGLELHETIRSEARDVTFLFMSGYTVDDLFESEENASAVSFIRKPWSIAELVNGVRRVLDDHGAADSSGAER